MKTLITYITSEWLFSRVDPDMLCQAKLCEVLLPTVSAQMLKVLLVATDVLLELHAIYLLATHIAQECSLVCWLTVATTPIASHYKIYVPIVHFMFHAQVLPEGS